jgi:hypothetical protein
MAWWSLALVTLIFFTPGIGLGSQIAADDVPLNISLGVVNASIEIPFTGPLRLLGISLAAWLVVWVLFYYVAERWLEPVEPKPTWWRNDNIYAFRPYVTGKIAERLALSVFGLAIASLLATVLLLLLPTLIAPYITELVGVALADQLLPILSEALKVLTGWGASPALIILCLLVLNAHRLSQWEEQDRLVRDLERTRRARGRGQQRQGQAQ